MYPYLYSHILSAFLEGLRSSWQLGHRGMLSNTYGLRHERSAQNISKGVSYGSSMDPKNGESTDQSETETRRLILNPTSGQGDHVERVNSLAASYGFPVEETNRPGHAIGLAEQAATDGVDLLAVCGGDGTVHEVVQGLVAADMLDSMTLCILPAGTENIVAGDIGISSLAHGFEVAEEGETRQLDIGVAGDEPFVMSAIAGLPATVSAAATHELKQRFGSFAFIIGPLHEGLPFDGVRVEVDAESEGDEVRWVGEALAVLVGNLRRFVKAGGQANAEDGLLEVTIVERMPSGELVAEAIEQRLLHQETSHVTELTATRLNISSLDEKSVTFSLDGEIREFPDVQIEMLSQALRLRVGAEYTPDPHSDGN